MVAGHVGGVQARSGLQLALGGVGLQALALALVVDQPKQRRLESGAAAGEAGGLLG
jgi:hypothetical protein